MVKNGIGEPGIYADPNTGLGIPNRIERAELEVVEGFPIGHSLDWVDVTFSPEIVVPDDAWANWDAANQVFLTAAEVYTETQTALFKSTVYYPDDLFTAVTWHDGSAFSPADFVMAMIMQFDLAKEESLYYDEAAVPGYDQFISAFKGTRIVSVDPFVVEYYGDNPALDAENSITTWWPRQPAYPYGDAAWHNMAVMLRAEGNGSIVFTDEKANNLEVERMNMIAGPSLEILAAELEAAATEGFIPFAATLGEYITADDAAARYGNLAEFARRYGHYYIGTGVYFLQGVFPVEGQAILQRWEAHPDPADRFAAFSAPALAEAEIDGPSRVTAGDEAVFDIFIDVFDGPYATADLNSVTYLLFDATGAQVESGAAEAVEDGLWQVILSPEVTAELEAGSNRLEVVVVSNLVALPSLAEYQFITE
jgi:peptide/nickel transport system substrate-binding protein